MSRKLDKSAVLDDLRKSGVSDGVTKGFAKIFDLLEDISEGLERIEENSQLPAGVIKKNHAQAPTLH